VEPGETTSRLIVATELRSALSTPEAPNSPIFAARALTKVYQMGEVTVQALRGVDFDLYARELVVLLGPSGSGKSTLLNILGGPTCQPPATSSMRITT
jgi:putative ABC transport system ATP-binding protein